MSKVLFGVSSRTLLSITFALSIFFLAQLSAIAADGPKIESINGPSELKINEDGVWKVIVTGEAQNNNNQTQYRQQDEGGTTIGLVNEGNQPTDGDTTGTTIGLNNPGGEPFDGETTTIGLNANNESNNDNRGNLYYKVNWGDESLGKKAVNAIVSVFNKNKDYEKKSTFSHSYKKSGEYTITVKVKDQDDNVSEKTTKVKVKEEQFPEAKFSVNKSSGDAPLEVIFKVNLGTRTQARIDFGDGSDIALVECDEPLNDNNEKCDTPIEVHHTYSDKGSYEAVLFKILNNERLVKDTLKIRVKTGNVILDFFSNIADAFQGAFDTVVENLFPGLAGDITDRDFANLPDINTDDYISGTRTVDEIEAIIINENPSGSFDCNFVPGPKKFQAYVITTTNEIGISDCASEDAYGYIDSIITNLMMRHGFSGLYLDIMLNVPIYIGNTGDSLLEVPGENEDEDPVEDPNKIGFEVKIKDQNGTTVQNWVQGNIKIRSTDILSFRWDARTGYKQCLPFLADNGSYALTRSDSKMLTGNTENENFNIYERSGAYYVECERTNDKKTVHTSVIEITIDDNGDRTVQPPTEDQYSLVKSSTNSLKVTINRNAPEGCSNDIKYVGEIDWGDGSVTKQPTQVTQECRDAQTLSESHTYKKAGTYKVLVKLNNVIVFRKEINVKESSSDQSGNVKLEVSENNPLKVNLTTNNADVNKKLSECKYSIGFYGASGNGLYVDWGDGTTEPADSMKDSLRGKSCTDVVTSHTYARAGNYTVTVTSWHPGPTDAPITDWKDSAIAKVGSGNNGSADFSASPLSGQAALKVTFKIPTDSNSTLTFGDRSKSRSFATCTGSDCGSKREVIHTYEKPGTYSARLITGCPIQSGTCTGDSKVETLVIEVK